MGVDVLDGLGSTWVLHVVLSNRPGDIRYGATGTPTPAYQAFIEELMRESVVGAGRFAGWIAPPRVGIDNKPGDFEYVRHA